MQFRKSTTTRKDRADKLKDEEVAKNSPIRELRKLRKEFRKAAARDPFVRQRAVAESYDMPKPPVQVSPRYPSTRIRPMHSPRNPLSNGSEMYRTQGSIAEFQERNVLS